MKRTHELDPDYNFAGSDLFFGVYYASRPKLLGGDPEKAKEHFTMLVGLAEADRITDCLKRKKWEIVRDEAKAGAAFLGTVI